MVTAKTRLRPFVLAGTSCTVNSDSCLPDRPLTANPIWVGSNGPAHFCLAKTCNPSSAPLYHKYLI